MYHFQTYKKQYKSNLLLALPVVLTQLGQILTQVADNIMVGQYGGDDPVPLAAVSFGGTVFFIGFIASIGIALGMTPLVGQHYARGEHQQAGTLLQNGIIFYTLVGLLMSALQFAVIPLMSHMGQPHDVVEMALPYYRLLATSLPFIMLFFAFKQFLEGVGNTKVETVITITSNVANVILNWILIFDHGDTPGMGAQGAGLATLLARMLTPILAIMYFLNNPKYRSYLRGFSLKSLQKKIVRKLLSMGIPISFQMFLEASAFVATSIMMGWLGKEAISANQIATTLGNCSFMIILSIGAATTIRVSHCYGRKDIDQLAMAAKASYHLMLMWGMITSVLYVSLRHFIPMLFTTNEEVIEIASQLMFFIALYQLSDGVQNASVSILRGLQDVKIIMPIAFLSYWILNIPVGYLCGFTLGMGPSGLFLGFTFGLSSAALLMIIRIRKRMRIIRAQNS